MTQSSGKSLLELNNIGKSFPGTRALDGVTLRLNAGEVVSLLGENGAGKSTLMKILSGAWPHGSFDGEIRLAAPDGSLVPARFSDTRDAHAAGISMIHQELSVFPELTVAEHLAMEALPHWIQWEPVFARAQRFLDTLGFGLRARDKVGSLSIGNQQCVEIARALYRDARILIFDEPTSALTEQETERLFGIIDRLRAEGRGILYITHRMDEIFRLSDRIFVLRDGRAVDEARARTDAGPVPRKELENKLISAMVGREIDNVYPRKNRAFGAEVLRVEGLRVCDSSGNARVEGATFQLRAGEVLGLAGLLGAGRSELMEGLFGVLNGAGPKGRSFGVEGRIWARGKECSLQNPRAAIDEYLAFVSEDRKGSGLVLGQSVRSNMVLPSLSAGRAELTRAPGVFAPVRGVAERSAVGRWRDELRIKLASVDQPVNELSGGNQQKVVLAKWLMTEPAILFLDEPTRGVDVGAKAEIYEWIQRLAAKGIGILLASSEMPELIGLCHRVIVLREGRFSAEFSDADVTQEKIMKAASL
ncbi:MAG: sugar ABC transporter ATP-binding protein [Bdellovibrionales bacterium]|nr:sugar ABC transporter ATP-binding protein [Bdellovibrionales bacterium]